MEDQAEVWEEDRCSLEYQDLAEEWVRNNMVKVITKATTSIFRIITIKTSVALEDNLQCMVEEELVHLCMIWSLKTCLMISLHLRTTIEDKLRQRIKCKTTRILDSLIKIPQCQGTPEGQWVVESKLRLTLDRIEMSIINFHLKKEIE